MKDRFTRGFLLGVLAGVPALIFALTAATLNLTTLRWAHFAAILIYGHKYENLPENIFAVFITFFFCGLMGLIFVFIVPKISSRNYLLKSWVFSITTWFFTFVIITSLKTDQLNYIPLKTAVSNFIEASIWGLSLGYCLKWFDERIIQGTK